MGVGIRRNLGWMERGSPLGFFVSVHSAGVKVLCFDTVLQVFILNGLWRGSVYKMVTSGSGGWTVIPLLRERRARQIKTLRKTKTAQHVAPLQRREGFGGLFGRGSKRGECSIC